ncbi:MAG: peptidoglycan-binding domain-containing protein, partial [Actinomycetota bacterium]
MTEVSTRSADPAPPSTNGHGPSDELPQPPAVYDAGGGRRWPTLLLGVAVGVGGTVAAVTLLDRQADEADDPAAATVELATAAVEQRDLIEEIEWTGTLGYAEPVAITGSGGTVTATATVGATLDRGDIILAVDNEPVVAMFGSTPMWRSLSEGDTGIDVLQLEANLAALGHDPDQTVDIDDTFTANTEAMVERWQTEIGAEVTGTVALGAVVLLDGPSVVSEAPEIGASGAGQLVTVAPRATVADVVASIDGVITAPADVGTPVEHGTVLYAIDEVAVAAVIDADPVADTLGEDSFTLVELEQALADGGFDPESEMTVDGVVTDATRAAIERWQADAGLPVTGQSDPGYYWIVPAGLTVESQAVEDGETIVAGGPVLTLSASQLAVEVTVDVADADEFTE